MSPILALLLLGLALGKANGENSSNCARRKDVAFNLGVTTNNTGHRQVNARLEQPEESTAWQLELHVGTESCQEGPRQQVLSFALIGSPLRAPLRAPVPSGYLLIPEMHGHFRHSDKPLEWAAARDECSREGAELATPATAAEAALLVQQLPANASAGASDASDIWVGAADIAKEGVFTTVAGKPLGEVSSVPWYSGYPNGGTSRNCLALWKSSKQLWDVACANKYPFYCKIPL